MLKNPLKNTLLNKKYQEFVNEINLFESDLKSLTDSELRAKSFKLQKLYQKTNDLNSLISQSFALTRESSQRTLGLRHFDVQLVGGLVLNNNKIAEMKTGEGKTLVATLPATLNALTKRGVQIVTVNDYLANRDQVSMGQIYRFLGLNTGLIQQGMLRNQRKKNYQSDITYVTNTELTFDYLRDNLADYASDIVLRPFNYCIIDEVDSILIDEAQTPIIISTIGNDPNAEKYIIASEIVKYFDINIDYKVDEKNKNVVITEFGIQKAEQLLQVNDLYNPSDPWIPYLINAVKALTLFFNNTNYIIQNEQIVIVDQFTGRIMPDRRWGDGLHQAVEAKEGLSIHPRAETKASTTYQNFFLLYPKLSGMTGTGKTAQIEFKKIYNLPVETIPTAQPSKRVDLPDLIYKDQFSKWDAIAKFCNTLSIKGQPVLIGTTTVEKSDMLSQLLKEYKLSHQILNAKPENVRRESQIIAQAGKKETITIATNMAGRGTDIILGGNINFQTQRHAYDLLVFLKSSINDINYVNNEFFKDRIVRKQLMKMKLKKLRTVLGFGCSHKCYSVLLNLLNDTSFLNLSDINILRILQENDRISIPTISYQCVIRFLLNELIYTNKKHHIQENQIVKNLGGLYVIGTERNDSQRIDNQLRGRCGRQGDPGTSRFFLSLDDDLLRLFGGAKLQNFIQSQIPDDSPLESRFINQSLDSAQQRVEERAYEGRKNLFDYDEIVNRQREIVYYERKLILLNLRYTENGIAHGERILSNYFTYLLSNTFKQTEIKQTNLTRTVNIFENLIGKNFEINKLKTFTTKWKKYEFSEWKSYFYQEFWLIIQLKIQEQSVYSIDVVSTLDREISLRNIDKIWQEYLEKLSLLREAVGWRGYAQSNPVTEYKREAYKLFLQRNQIFVYYTLYDLIRTIII